MATIKDIAKEANCSLSTVSRVINNSGYVSESKRKEIESIIKRMNYIPSAMATHLSRGKNNIIGVVIPEIDNPFFSGVIKGINDVSDINGLNVILCDSGENIQKEANLIRALKRQRVSGLILTSAYKEHHDNSKHIQFLKNLDIPLVLLDRELIGYDCDSVFFDDEKAIFDITSLLINNGHRHIEMLAGNTDLILGQNRSRGYTKAFLSRNLDYKKEWKHFSLFTKEAGYIAMNEILNKKQSNWPTAIVANNNMLTLGALKAIFERDLRIPDDIAFVGYDRIEVLEYLKINITLAEKDTVEMGKVAMELLLRKISNKGTLMQPQKIIMTPSLKVRGSEKFTVTSHVQGI